MRSDNHVKAEKVKNPMFGLLEEAEIAYEGFRYYSSL